MQGEWISVKDRLPENYDSVLVYCKGNSSIVDVCSYSDSIGFMGIAPYWIELITHWMPLPEPPKEN